jgi:hypothetical protein
MTKFEAGDEIEVIGNASGLNQMGMKYTVAGYNGMYVRMVEQPQWNFIEGDLKLKSLTKERLQERCEKAHVTWRLLKDKMEYIEETNSLKYDDKEFRTYQVKKLLNDEKMTNDEKAQRIAMIFS